MGKKLAGQTFKVEPDLRGPMMLTHQLHAQSTWSLATGCGQTTKRKISHEMTKLAIGTPELSITHEHREEEKYNQNKGHAFLQAPLCRQMEWSYTCVAIKTLQ